MKDGVEMVEVSLIDALLSELIRVAAIAPSGSSFEAARQMNITPDAELKVRKGLLWKKDVPSNHQNFRQLIQIYKNLSK